MKNKQNKNTKINENTMKNIDKKSYAIVKIKRKSRMTKSKTEKHESEREREREDKVNGTKTKRNSLQCTYNVQ